MDNEASSVCEAFGEAQVAQEHDRDADLEQQLMRRYALTSGTEREQ